MHFIIKGIGVLYIGSIMHRYCVILKRYIGTFGEIVYSYFEPAEFALYPIIPSSVDCRNNNIIWLYIYNTEYLLFTTYHKYYRTTIMHNNNI